MQHVQFSAAKHFCATGSVCCFPSSAFICANVHGQVHLCMLCVKCFSFINTCHLIHRQCVTQCAVCVFVRVCVCVLNAYMALHVHVHWCVSFPPHSCSYFVFPFVPTSGLFLSLSASLYTLCMSLTPSCCSYLRGLWSSRWSHTVRRTANSLAACETRSMRSRRSSTL